jgi:hypothetical protein
VRWRRSDLPARLKIRYNLDEKTIANMHLGLGILREPGKLVQQCRSGSEDEGDNIMKCTLHTTTKGGE